ncbi:MAG: DUF3108 domain-containing protein [Pseudomonadota bacterium]
MRLIAALLLALLATAVSAQEPQRFELTYRFTFNGLHVGKVTDRFERKGSRYQLVSMAVPNGGLAQLLPMLTLSSEGEIRGGRFLPYRYRQERSNASGKIATAEFEWHKKVLTQTYKGKSRQAVLSDGTQDALTQLYTVPLAGELTPQLEFDVSNGRELIHYRYEKLPGGMLETPLGSFETVEYRRIVANPGDNAISVWIAPALHHLPLRIRVREESGVFEQELVRLDYRAT